MRGETAKAYLESLILAYDASMVVGENESYRMIWVSENDIRALRKAIEELRDE